MKELITELQEAIAEIAKLRAEVEICRADVGEAAGEANYWRMKCEAAEFRLKDANLQVDGMRKIIRKYAFNYRGTSTQEALTEDVKKSIAATAGLLEKIEAEMLALSPVVEKPVGEKPRTQEFCACGRYRDHVGECIKKPKCEKVLGGPLLPSVVCGAPRPCPIHDTGKPVGEKPRERNRCYCCGGTEHCKMCGAEPCKCAEKRNSDEVEWRKLHGCICSEYDGKGRSTCGGICPVHGDV